MDIIESYDYLETTKNGFDYPSESVDSEDVYETVSKWLDDFGWV